MDRLIQDMELFVAVGRSRNFGRAATALGIPSSTLSRRIAALEKSLGLRLLNRSTRKVELTEDGEVYLNRVEHIVEDALRAHEELRDRKSKPHGHLRVSMPHGLATDLGMYWLGEFSQLYPEITYEINTEPGHIDLIADRFDVAVRLGRLLDSQLYARRVTSFSRFLYASPDYLAKHGAPKLPHDLVRHECILLGDAPGLWVLNRNNTSVSINVTGRFTCDATVLAPPLAIAGLGVAQALKQRVRADEAAGRLVRVLPDWQSEASPLLIVTPTRLVPRRTRLLVDFLAAKIRALTA